LPLDMLTAEPPEDDRKAQKLERLYHKGQQRAWDGKAVLAELVAKYGPPDLPDAERQAVQRLFAVILWGELAAWKISADLAVHVQPLGAKMAATQQAHDEARHFYVLRDYLALLGDIPTEVGPGAKRVLHGALGASNLAKKLLGMQLMIEPMALSVFQVMRERRLEPVLADLLAYYERDEARHVALGVLYLPTLLRGASRRDALDLYQWQLREYFAQFTMVKEIADAFEVLGIDARDVVEVGQKKQLLAAQLLADEMGVDWPIVELFRRATDARLELEWPKRGADNRLSARAGRAWRRAVGHRTIDGPLSDYMDDDVLGAPA